MQLRLLSRLPAILAFLSLAAVFLVGVIRHHDGSRSGWEQLQVKVLPLGPWEDTKFIAYAIDCDVRGVNPYVTMCEPKTMDYTSVYNYLPVWLQLRHLGVTVANSVAMAWCLLLLTVVAYSIALRAVSRFSAVAVFCAIALSHPLRLAMERANTDEVIFFLLVVSCALVARLPLRVRPWVLGSAVAVLTCLKIYPVAAAVSTWRTRRGWQIAILSAVVSAGLLFAAAGHAVKYVFANTPQSVYTSFGIIPTIFAVGRLGRLDLQPWVESHRSLEGGVAVLLFAAAAAVGAVRRRPLSRILPPLGADSFRGMLALACAGIYCFAYAAGASFDYRLIFLTGPLAFLLEAHDAGQRAVRPAIILLIVYLAIPYRFVVIHEAFDLATFLLLAVWLGCFLADSDALLPRRRPRSSAMATA